MIRYAVARVASAVLVLLGVSAVVFAVADATPGDPLAGQDTQNMTEEQLAGLRAAYGLDRPPVERYLAWLGQFAIGNWGTSLSGGRPVTSLVLEPFANTLVLTVAAVLLCLVFGTLIGAVAGFRQGSVADRISMGVVQIGHNAPTYWFGVVLVGVFALWLGWLPASGMRDLRGDGGVVDLLRHLALPAVAASFGSMLILARLVRSKIIDISHADYIRLFRSLGISPARIRARHYGRNTLPTVITITGLQIGALMSGVLFVEKVFVWPGIGTQLFNAIAAKDFLVIQAGVMLVAVTFVTVNLITDLTLDALNPRLRTPRRTA
ncbi:ABC transporter permease [Mycetocola reblochoni]|uniref:Oligopeptide transport system permease protein OppB (TC 3.A.1.5.1) n=2 Tax=Mycetocola reblochoni TaxID=331618 RepID=A0A1R4IVW6_9MICO|nr:ABC transporter permease [Mycetocola reblochoni]RLP71005.1 ABC transporter permease [Mycetocola reblochoni]SJN23725.1 Oligopeptide transport system permease protein OppB (TC 3.A.1.5.1) [Mycetocola reblochoni REB411]